MTVGVRILSVAMLKNRPFQVFVMLLIALGLHICCCRVAMFSIGSGDSGESSLESQLCNHEHGEPNDNDSTPEPSKSPYNCCGVHDKPLTSQVCKIDVPLRTLVAVLFFISTRVESIGFDFIAPCAKLAAPAPETTLLQRHCALIV